MSCLCTRSATSGEISTEGAICEILKKTIFSTLNGEWKSFILSMLIYHHSCLYSMATFSTGNSGFSPFRFNRPVIQAFNLSDNVRLYVAVKIRFWDHSAIIIWNILIRSIWRIFWNRLLLSSLYFGYVYFFSSLEGFDNTPTPSGMTIGWNNRITVLQCYEVPF